MIKLQKCPFCGHKIIKTIGYAQIKFFKCYGCGAVMSFNDNENAEELFNRRFNDE